MKTYCRLTKYTPFNTEKIQIEIFKKQTYGQYCFNSIGYVTFSRYKDNFVFESFKVEADQNNFQNLFDMGNLLKYAQKYTSWDSDIQEFLNLIHYEELINFNWMQIPVRENGNHVFALYDTYFNEQTQQREKSDSVYTRICAPNQKIAEQIAKKLYPKFFFEIVKERKIQAAPFDFSLYVTEPAQ